MALFTGVSSPELPPKDPQSDEWFVFSWAMDQGEEISSYSWLINGTVAGVGETVDGMTVEEETQSGGDVQVRLSGGVVDSRYRVTSRVSTNLQPSRDVSFRIKVREL